MGDGRISKIFKSGQEGLRHLVSEASEALLKGQEHSKPHVQKSLQAQLKIQEASLKSKNILPGVEIEDRTCLSDEVTGRKSSGAKSSGVKFERVSASHGKDGHVSSKSTEFAGTSNKTSTEKSSRTERNVAEGGVKEGRAHGTEPVKDVTVSGHQRLGSEGGSSNNKSFVARDCGHPTVDGKTYLRQLQEQGVKIIENMRSQEASSPYVKLRGQDEYMANRQKVAHAERARVTTKSSQLTDPWHEKTGNQVQAERKPAGGAQSRSAESGLTSKPPSGNCVQPVERSGLRAASGKLVNGGFGVLSIAGGLYELRDGIRDFRQGKFVSGALSTSAGVSDAGSGIASIACTFGNRALSSVALRLGGAGAVFSGAGESLQGIRERDHAKMFEGGLKVTLGAGMFASGSTAPLCASGLAGWGAGRFIGERVSFGGQNVDTRVTSAFDASWNRETNQEFSQLSADNLKLLKKQGNLIGKDEADIRTEGVSRSDVTEAIIGLREQLEAERRGGAGMSGLEAELRRLIDLRGRL